MSLRALPLLVIAVILYNVIVLLGGSADANQVLSTQILPKIKMLSGGEFIFTWGDFLIMLTLVLLFVELVKATYTSSASLLDHGLSMLVFVVCLIEFLLVRQAATSIFFIITMAVLIDVIAGYTIGIRVAKRDLNIGEQ
jgi:hypothetical protein